MLALTERAQELFNKEDNILHLTGHVVVNNNKKQQYLLLLLLFYIQVVGDIHGQCCDLLSVFEHTKGGDMIWGPHTTTSGEQTSSVQVII